MIGSPTILRLGEFDISLPFIVGVAIATKGCFGVFSKVDAEAGN